MSSVHSSSNEVDHYMVSSLLDSINTWTTTNSTDSQKLQGLIISVHGLIGAMHDDSKTPDTLEKQLVNLANTMERMKANLGSKKSNESDMKELHQNMIDVSDANVVPEANQVPIMTSLMQQAAISPLMPSPSFPSALTSVYPSPTSSSYSIPYSSLLSSSSSQFSPPPPYSSTNSLNTLPTKESSSSSLPSGVPLQKQARLAMAAAEALPSDFMRDLEAQESIAKGISDKNLTNVRAHLAKIGHPDIRTQALKDICQAFAEAFVEAEELQIREQDNHVVNASKFPTFSGAPKAAGANSSVSNSIVSSSPLSQGAPVSPKTISQLASSKPNASSSASVGLLSTPMSPTLNKFNVFSASSSSQGSSAAINFSKTISQADSSKPSVEADTKAIGGIDLGETLPRDFGRDLAAKEGVENYIKRKDLGGVRMYLASIGHPDVRTTTLDKICVAFPDEAITEAEELAARRAADKAANAKHPQFGKNVSAVKALPSSTTIQGEQGFDDAQLAGGIANVSQVATETFKLKESLVQAIEKGDLFTFFKLNIINPLIMSLLAAEDNKMKNQALKLIAKESLALAFQASQKGSDQAVAEDIVCPKTYPEFHEMFSRWLDKLKALQCKANELPSEDRIQALQALRTALSQPRSALLAPTSLELELLGPEPTSIAIESVAKRSTMFALAWKATTTPEIESDVDFDAIIKEFEKPSKLSTWQQLAEVVQSELFCVYKSADKQAGNLKANAFRVIKVELQKALQTIDKDLIEAQKK